MQGFKKILSLRSEFRQSHLPKERDVSELSRISPCQIKVKNHSMEDHAENSSGKAFCQLIYRPESGQKATLEIKIES